ncbi:DEAD/DEAH box helicase family protein [Rhodosalinus sp. FB01]|uniref:DEAD/DEAH box helicase family protein n=1 Tax=Rhodosalinus sp. FB01 TaxID=3239194 RepID=UPI003523ABE2
MFDTVIVVSDRRVIDGQLQEAIFSFERTLGVVETIKGDGGSKSGQLAQALAEGKKIVVCTIQTFPLALDEVRRLSATQGKTFAVIADEAHSSQTGEARGLHDPDVPPRFGRGEAALGDARKDLRGHRRRGAQLADR